MTKEEQKRVDSWLLSGRICERSVGLCRAVLSVSCGGSMCKVFCSFGVQPD